MHKKKSKVCEELFPNSSENTKKAYTTTIRKYESFHKISMENLIREALEEQENNVPEHQLSIYNRIMDFQSYLIDNYVHSTIKHDITRIKTIYKRSRVRLPYFPPLDPKNCKHNDFIDYYEVITKDEIKLALPYLTDNLQARVMLMATGGYSLNETDTMTVRKFLDELYPYHHEKDPNLAMRILAAQDNIVWVSKMVRVKTQKPYYGFCNPETTQAIAKSWVDKVKDIDAKLFRQTKQWVTRQMGGVNDALGFGKAGGFRRFTPHPLRRFNATNLNGASLSYEEEMQIRNIDELQGRGMTDTQSRYIKTNPLKQKLLYVKVMNNVSLYNQYTYEIFDGDVLVHRVDKDKKIKNLSDENKMLQRKVEATEKIDNSLKKEIEVIGKDKFKERMLKLLSEL